jgi:P-type Ca2+ transporter type 2C
MTVRAVITASGRVTFAGTGYAPQGEVSRDRDAIAGDPESIIGGALRVELERALAVGDRANNAVLQERDDRWTVQGDPTEGARSSSLRARPGSRPMRSRCASHASRKFPSRRSAS